MKKVAILGPTSSTDVWNIPISFFNWFKKLGHEVVFYNTLVNDKFDDSSLLKLIADYNSGQFVPDIVLHLDFGLFTSSYLRKEFIPSAKWIVESGDDPQNFSLNFSKIKHGEFDVILSPDIRCVERYNAENINAVWCPYFADPDQFKITQEPLFDAVTTRSIEEPFFKQLKQTLGDKFEARVDFLQGEDHSRHLMKGNVVIQNSKYREISRRIFEGMMANRMVVTDRPDPNTRIDLIFKENEDIVYFDSFEDCVEKVQYYSANHQERLRIAQRGFDTVSSKHTTLNRINKLLQLL
jgi:hypothetical protein